MRKGTHLERELGAFGQTANSIRVPSPAALIIVARVRFFVHEGPSVINDRLEATRSEVVVLQLGFERHRRKQERLTDELAG